MRAHTSLFLLATFATTGLAACLDADDRGLEEEIPGGEGKDDSFYHPTEHGAIGFGVAERSLLTEDERHHTWTFELSADADVEMTTSYALLGQRKTDTVLYLYKEGPSGWGPYIARNDNYDGKVYSQLIRHLAVGRYRVLVKGYLATTMGKFKITVGCNGLGCAPPAPPVSEGCVFGGWYGEIADIAALHIDNKNVLTAASVPNLSAAEADRIVRAVQQSSHDDVTTAAEAFSRVDQGEINAVWISEPAARRSYIAYEYGAGDNSYGAIFNLYTGEMVTNIHDGDLENCIPTAETCLLPSDYYELRQDPAFVLNEGRVVTAADQLDGVELEQVLGALRQLDPGLTDIDAGLAMTDDEQVNLRQYFYSGTNTDLTVVEFGAGDTSIGAIYYTGSTQLAGVISDLFIYNCSLFAAKGVATVGESCRGPGDCVSGSSCAGVFAGAGVCVTIFDPPNEGASCASDAACGSAELVCAGVTQGGGLCRQAWMRGSFAGEGGAVPDAGALLERVVVRGLATVDTDVIMHLRIDHPRASQLRITLTNPATAEVLVHDGTAADDGHPLVIDAPVLGFSGDEQVNGEWTLRVEDRSGGDVGTLAPWQMVVTSRFD